MSWITAGLLLSGLLGACGFLAYYVLRQMRTLREQLAAYRRGDYRKQLELIEGFRTGGSEPPHYLFFRGAACFELGRLEEAEQALRRSLSMERGSPQRTLCLDQIGRVLMEWQRWEEAEACFRECIEESPARGGGPRAIAELLLRQGVRDTEALALARSAAVADRAAVTRGALGKEAHDLNLSESLSVLAWAVAKNRGDPAEVRGALKEAFALCPETTRPVRSAVHYYAAMAYAELGEAAESSRQFGCGAEIDPDGNYGRLARSVLAAAARG